MKAAVNSSRFFFFFRRHRDRRIVSPSVFLADSHSMGTQEGERGEAVTGPGPGADELATRSQSHHVHWVLLLTSAFWWAPTLEGCRYSLPDCDNSNVKEEMSSDKLCHAVKLLANKAS